MFIMFTYLLCSIAVAIFILTVMDYIDFIFAHKQDKIPKLVEPFVLSEYFEHIEKAFIDTLQNQKHVDHIIVLWFGLDGLRMNEDGAFEWISREKPKPDYQNISYQMCQSAPILFDGLQNTQATQEQIFALKMQLDMANFNIALQNQMQGINSAIQSQQSVFALQPIQCCCNLYK